MVIHAVFPILNIKTQKALLPISPVRTTWRSKMGNIAAMPDELQPAEQQTYVIRYRTAPAWLVPSVRAIAVITGLLVVFYGLPFSAAEPGSVMEALVRLIVISAICFSSWLIAQIAKYDKLFLTKDGLYFPSAFAPDLLFRRKRSWDDIGNILLGVMLLSDRKGTYEYELETTKDKKKLFIYFKSGGHATVELDRMSKENAEKFFRSIESWCIACRRSPQLSASGSQDVAKFPQQSQGKKLEQLSFTKMWEEDLHDHFSATNFVPLVKGAELQGGRLKILMHLASGGLSAVYLAEQSDKELRVVKEAALPSTTEASRSEKARQLFAREAKILCELSHPQIARVIDFFVENGRDYLVLEFIPGQSLRQLVRKSGTLSEDKVLDLALQVTEILDYLHRQSPPVLHRDVTPDNLVLREDGKVVLIDFGAANNLVGTATGTLIGKQSYIAPEQFRGKATPQSDIYSLGCTMFYLLTGQDPVPLCESQPSKLMGLIAVGVNDLVRDCTHTEIEQRIQNTQELSARIEGAKKNDLGAVLKISGAV